MQDEPTEQTGEPDDSSNRQGSSAAPCRVDASDPRWRNLLRLAGVAAVKKAERDYVGRAHVTRRELVVVTVDTAEAIAAPSRCPLSCSFSCQTMAQGPAAEHGHRSHADGLWRLAAALGFTMLTIRVRVNCVRTDPVKFAVEEVLVQEAK